MSKLVLLRHGESEWNKKNLFTGWVDVDITKKGVEEAVQAGKKIKQEKIEFSHIFTSVLRRANQTLFYVLNELDLLWMPVENSWRLNERHYGALQGLNKQKTIEKYGEEEVHKWRRGYHSLPPLLSQEEANVVLQDSRYKDLKKVPRGENLEITLERVMPYFEEKIKPRLMLGQNVLVVAHGNSLRALIKHLENLSEEEIMELNLPTATPIVYDLDDNLKIQNKIIKSIL